MKGREPGTAQTLNVQLATVHIDKEAIDKQNLNYVYKWHEDTGMHAYSMHIQTNTTSSS